ncbi:MAG: hypothetical protein ABI678_28070 [Kofleriaceae bacterium]
MELRDLIANQIHDHRGVATGDHAAHEPWRVLPDLNAAADGGRDVCEQGSAPRERRIVDGEETEIVGRAVSEIKAGERSAAGQEEPVFTVEECAERLELQGRQRATRRGGHRCASPR